MKKQKILIIHETLCGGGAEKVLMDILDNFDFSRYEVDLLLWEAVGLYLPFIPSNVNIMYVHEGRMSWFHRIIMHLPESVNRCFVKKWLEKPMKGKRYDTIISFLEGTPARIHSLLLKAGHRNISWIHSDMNHDHWSNAFFDYKNAITFYSAIDRVVFVSEGSRNAFMSAFPNVDIPSVVIHNIQNPDRIRERAVAEKIDRCDMFSVCCVGRLELPKRFDRVLEIASYLKNCGYNFKFCIVGQGTMDRHLREEAKRLGVDESVEFVGFQRNPYKYMAAADVFLLTSQYEGYALVVGEALSLGKPVVSTKVTGPVELLKDDVGVLCEHDVAELSEALIRLYDNPDMRIYYGQRALEKSRDFDPQNTMKKIYSIL